VALNRIVDEATAREIKETFFEDIVAPGYTDAALAILKRKRDLRILQVDPGSPTPPALIPGSRLDFKRISGGFLVQTPDHVPQDAMHPTVVSKREPTLRELTDLLFAWRAVKHVKSNAIVLAKNLATVGIGSGQTSRVESVRIAVHKAGDRAVDSVLASDAFFPFADGVEVAAEAGVRAIIQPGGSIRDDDAIKAADKHGMVMLFTGMRHFRH
jgi:phosphoribosylaminoimidazolecarboxamide formyltransferase/IMP cyclohydrolase